MAFHRVPAPPGYTPDAARPRVVITAVQNGIRDHGSCYECAVYATFFMARERGPCNLDTRIHSVRFGRSAGFVDSKENK